jgi:hypothetical protein
MPNIPSLPDLVATGDRAVALGDAQGLCDTARLLHGGLGESLEAELFAVERLARTDLGAAVQHWSIVSQCLRDWVASSFVHR